jgi:4-amino-4-deoxy-L-arabinose transferase-like glycosyltransferase
MGGTDAIGRPAATAARLSRGGLILAAMLLAGFALRVAYRVHLGEHDFWSSGYSFFNAIAKNVVAGHGLFAPGRGWAARQPVYPLFLAVGLLLGGSYLPLVICEALFGVATALLAFLIGRRWFGERAGLIAAALAALYPYYVVHDTALQDTSMVGVGATLAVWVFLRARISASAWAWLGAGLVAVVIVLIRGTLLPFSLGAIAWIALLGDGAWRTRLLRAGVVAAACGLVLGVWVARNYEHTGRLMLSSEVGAEFYWANGPYTFRFYPHASMDQSAGEAQQALTRAARQTLAALPEAQRSDWYMAEGWRYVAAHPGEIAAGALRKEAAGFSWVLNPEREGPVGLAYTLSYMPLLALGLAGMALARIDWREASLVGLQFAGFIVVTAIFWAHTSHRVYLDVYLMVFAALVIERIVTFCLRSLRGRDGPAGRRVR